MTFYLSKIIDLASDLNKFSQNINWSLHCSTMAYGMHPPAADKGSLKQVYFPIISVYVICDSFLDRGLDLIMIPVNSLE